MLTNEERIKLLILSPDYLLSYPICLGGFNAIIMLIVKLKNASHHILTLLALMKGQQKCLV